MNKKPNFLIVGGAKCGSTSLYNYLNQHPEVYMPLNKEPNFLVGDYQKQMNKDCPSYKVDQNRMVFDVMEYWGLFKNASDEHKAIGEASVTYLYKPEFAIPRIKEYLGDPKIIIILRNPVQRAFSHYSYACELGFEKEGFEAALNLENKRLASGWSSTFAYTDQGMYANQVKAYLSEFSNVHVIILEEFIKNEQKSLQELYNFLGVDSSFINNFTETFNVSGIPKFQRIHNFLVHENIYKTTLKRILSRVIPDEKLRKAARSLRQKNQSSKMEMDLRMKIRLAQFYQFEIESLENVIGHKIPSWRS